MTCHVALKQTADGALSDDSFDEGTRHYLCLVAVKNCQLLKICVQ